MNYPKIAVVGPVPPYRGGISRYSWHLYQSLRRRTSVKIISYYRQYPKWLYPGQDDKESAASKVVDNNVYFIIDAYSPFSIRRAARQIIATDTDVAIITWWTFFWYPGMAYLSRLLRHKGIRVIFLCHNLYDHDANRILRYTSIRLLKGADAYIVHDTDEQQELIAYLPEKKVLMCQHPIEASVRSEQGVKYKRGKLELLFFGFIRPYKGLDILLGALKQLQDKNIYTSIVGEYWGDPMLLVEKIKGEGIPNIELNLRYVSDDDTKKYFKRADVVVLPYLTATGSGVAAQAFTYGKPVLASRVGGFKDVVQEDKTGWLVEPNSPRALAETIKSLNRKKAESMKLNIKEFCQENSWDNFAKKLLEFISNL